MKKFKNKEELNEYIEKVTNEQHKAANPDASDMMLAFAFTDEKDLATRLIADGYDMDDLVEDGHAYCLDGHTNNGWLYHDEVDWDYINNPPANLPEKEVWKEEDGKFFIRDKQN